MAGRLEDISVGGAFFRLVKGAALPRRVFLRLFLPAAGEGPIVIPARVVEIRGCQVRVSYDPLVRLVAEAIVAETRVAGASDAGPLPN